MFRQARRKIGQFFPNFHRPPLPERRQNAPELVHPHGQFPFGGSTLVADLVNRQVALIGAFGPPAAQAAKAATTTIPIVFTSIDPVKFGLVASLNRSGGKATGVHVLTIDLEGKRLELLSEMVPASAPVAVLINPHGEHAEQQAKDVQAGGVPASAGKF
jgi:ABC transporter substrate binding protein